MVRLGEYDFASDSDGEHKDFLVTRTTPHEHYDKSLMINDIAILQLARNVEFNGKLIIFLRTNVRKKNTCLFVYRFG